MVIVPPTPVSAFHLPANHLLTLTQYVFLTTSLACLAQVICGHHRAIMEGPTGLWWGTIPTITLAGTSRGTPLDDIATSPSVGTVVSAVLTMIIGSSGSGRRLVRPFTLTVMVPFMLLLGVQLTTIFFKGTLDLPFGIADASVKIQLAPFSLIVAVMCFILAMIIFSPRRISRYTLLVGAVVGWGFWRLCFPSTSLPSSELIWQRFPLGNHDRLLPGVILAAVITDLVNISNTCGTVRGTDVFYAQQGSSSSRYRRSFIISGFITLVAVPFAAVPFPPFVSSIGLSAQTSDSSRKSFICGGVLCLFVAIVIPLTRLFRKIPLAISSAVMLVSYLPLLYSGLVFSQQITFTARNIYQLALPLFVGIFLMRLSPVYLQDPPLTIRPLLSNGLLVGILLAVLMESLILWERIE